MSVSMALRVFEIEPSSPHRGTVIWMHGLGASEHDFEDLVPELELSGVRFVFPAAPHRPVTINGGIVMPAWYDITTVDASPSREHEPDVRASAAEIEELIEQEERRGVPSTRIVVMGFSQGGAMALHVGLRHSQPLAGIGVLSGYMLLPDRFEAERSSVNEGTSLLFCHGEFDPIVPLALGKRAFERVQASGYPADFHQFPMQHSMCMQEVRILAEWLASRFDTV
jgi:phospholipase/carboxylesterase